MRTARLLAAIGAFAALAAPTFAAQSSFPFRRNETKRITELVKAANVELK